MNHAELPSVAFQEVVLLLSFGSHQQSTAIAFADAINAGLFEHLRDRFHLVFVKA